MTDIIRKKVVEVEMPEQEVLYEKVSERVENFTIEQIDRDITKLQSKIDELKSRKTEALGLK